MQRSDHEAGSFKRRRGKAKDKRSVVGWSAQSKTGKKGGRKEEGMPPVGKGGGTRGRERQRERERRRQVSYFRLRRDRFFELSPTRNFVSTSRASQGKYGM